MCQQKQQATRDYSSEVGALFLGSVEEKVDSEEGKIENINSKSPWEIKLTTQHGSITFKIDTGADVTVIGLKHLPSLGIKENCLQNNHRNLVGPDKHALECIGSIPLTFQWNNKKHSILCYVCKGVQQALLGRPAIEEMNIVKMNANDHSTKAINAVSK